VCLVSDTNTCDYVQLINFFFIFNFYILPVSTCQYHVGVGVGVGVCVCFIDVLLFF